MFDGLQGLVQRSVLAIGLMSPLLATCLGPVYDPPDGVLWLRIAHISDTQIIDEESPARLVRGDLFVGPAWRPQEAYSVHTFDATLRVINAIHAAKPLDFVILTGDATDNAQWNELDWFLKTWDGGVLDLDSGAKEGVNADIEDAINPNLPYETEGLTRDLPWYTVFGNHDNLAIGNFRVDRSAAAAEEWFSPLETVIAIAGGLHLGNRVNLLPTDDWSSAVLLADENPMWSNTYVINLLALATGTIPPDPDRRFIDRNEFIAAHFGTETLPSGHGFNETNLSSGDTHYSVKPVEGVPVRIIALDTTAPNPPWGYPAFYGSLSRDQFENFLQPEVRAAEEAGEYVIIASHHPSDDFDTPMPGSKNVTAYEFQSWLASRPNVIMHLCGHTHRNHVNVRWGVYPYVEIETGSIIDYPQEGRLLEVYYLESIDSFRVTSSMFGHMDHPTPHSRESFARAKWDAGVFWKAETATGWQTFTERYPDLAEHYSVEDFYPSLETRMGSETDRVFSVTLSRSARQPE